MNRLGACCIAPLALFAIGLSGCGGGEPSANTVVVRVGGQAITKATVARWTEAIRRGGAFTGFRGKSRPGTPRQRAVALLASSYWLIGEAAREGVPVSQEAVDGVLAERAQGAGEAEFRKQLKASGQTLAGLKLELRAELALEAIKQELARRASEISPAEVVAYYRRHPELFSTPEVRDTDIIEGLPSAAAATALVRRVGTGRGFAQLAMHKKVEHTTGVLSGPESKKRVDYAIYAARPGVVSRPMLLLEGWSVFVVRKIIPRRLQPLAKVRDQVIASLTTAHTKRIALIFAHDYVGHWRASTRCRRGYVAPGCSTYAHPLGAYEDPFLIASRP